VLIVNSDRMTREKLEAAAAGTTVLFHKSTRPRRRPATSDIPKIHLRDERFHIGYAKLSNASSDRENIICINFDKRGSATLVDSLRKRVSFNTVRLLKQYRGAENLRALVARVKARVTDKAARSGEI
jgi:hypothetical protein